MRKVRLKKWVIIALVIINFLAAVIASGECDDLALDIVIKIIAISIIALNGFLLIRFGDLEERQDFD